MIGTNIQSPPWVSTKTGTITTQNLNVSGTATAGSALEMELMGASMVTVYLASATVSGTSLSPQVSNDGIFWQFVPSTFNAVFDFGYQVYASGLNYDNGTAGRLYKVMHVSGFRYFRIYANSVVGSTITAILVGGQVDEMRVGLSRINGNSLTTGAGSAGTGVLRFALANDSFAAEDAALTGNPLPAGGKVRTANLTTLAAGDAAFLTLTTGGAQLVKSGGLPELDWQMPSPAAITTAGATLIKSAAGAGLRNYIQTFQYINTGATGSEITITDGATTVIWRGYAPADMKAPAAISLLLRSSANALLNFNVLAATGTNLYINAQGYVAP